jgi:hypothetical protein
MHKHMMMHWETWRYGPNWAGTWRRYVPGAGLWTIGPPCDHVLREHDRREIEVDRQEVHSHVIGGIVAAIVVASCIVLDFIAETLAGQ